MGFVCDDCTQLEANAAAQSWASSPKAMVSPSITPALMFALQLALQLPLLHPLLLGPELHSL